LSVHSRNSHRKNQRQTHPCWLFPKERFLPLSLSSPPLHRILLCAL